MDYDLNNLAPTLIGQIQPPLPLNSKSIINIICQCGTKVSLNYRAFLRKWRTALVYLCKSCHVKTYSSEASRIEKFRESFSKTAATQQHKEKCRKAAKKLWDDAEKRQQLIEKITKDNKENPKKAAARQLALAALLEKPWFHKHMQKIRKKANEKQRSNTAKFIASAKLVHNDSYNYGCVDYIRNNDNVTIICPTHGEFKQSPHNHLQGKGCKHCNLLVTKQHQFIIDIIQDTEIVVNDRNIISPYEIDVWLPQYRIGIEINGEYWHGIRIRMTHDEILQQRARHALKATKAAESNVKLYQFWDSEIIKKPEIIKSMIMHSIGKSNKTYARKCDIKQNIDLKAFFDSTHLQGYRNSSINYALIDDGVMCGLSISKHNKYEWEIIRYSNKLNTTVVGGFSRLLNAFILDHKPSMIVSFADRRFSVGNVYKSNGFQLEYITEPNYFYINGMKISSRQQCQKHKLSKLLGDAFDASLSETKNMLLSGYIKVYDAGHSKFVRRL